MGIFDWLRRKQKQPASVAEDRRATPVDNAISRLSVASDEARVGAAMELLKSSDHEVRAAVASEVARLEIKAVGVWYELANALADDHESVRQASAKAFWQLDGVGYAIRSLRDEHENPAHMNSESALRGIHALMEVAPEKSNFDDLLKENWQDCPILKRNDLSKSEKLPAQKDDDERPECAKCGLRFKWGEAYKCQDTPGAIPYTPQGYGDDIARVFCPHCGAIVVQWHITREKDYDEWIWFGKNATINQGRPLPPSPITHWGIGIPPHLRPDYRKEGLDIEKIQQYQIEKKAQRQKVLEKEENSEEKDDIDWSTVSNFYEFANTLESKGDYKGAEKAYRLAIEEKTLNSVAAHNGLGNLFVKQERYDEAIKILKKATVDYPDNGIAFQNLAFLLINLNRLKEAEAIYEKAMKIAPGHPITNSIKSRLEEKQAAEQRAEPPKRPGVVILGLRKPFATFPFVNSLVISPHNKDICWISRWNAGRFKISVLSPTDESPRFELNYTTSKISFPGQGEKLLVFAGRGRLLIAMPLNASLTRLVLLDVDSGKELSVIDVPNFRFFSLSSNKKGMIAAQKDQESLLIVSITDDKLTHRLVQVGQQSITGPNLYFASNGKLYAIHNQSLFSIEGDRPVRVTSTINVTKIAFGAPGKVYFGKRGDDRSEETSLQIFDLESRESYEIKYDGNRIDFIEPVGSNKLLIGGMIFEAKAVSKWLVSLFCITERKKKWSIEVNYSRVFPYPVLLTAPEDGWALLQSEKLLKWVLLDKGEVLEELPKGENENLGARWLGSQRMLCLSRNRFLREAAGTLELYKIE